MGILNVTPDSFSDGGQAFTLDDALRRAEQIANEGADIIDIGGESTRPGSERVSVEEEIRRVVPVIEEISRRFDVPVSVDTTKSEVASAAVRAGAEIINDISGLRFDEKITAVAARYGTGLVLMHSLGDFETLHAQEPVPDIMAAVAEDFQRSTTLAIKLGLSSEQIALDVGIGFGKTLEQNLELVAKLDELVHDFPQYPMLVGTSRKSFICKTLSGEPSNDRVSGSLATVAIAVWNGARILRVHDLKETVAAARVAEAIKATIRRGVDS
jgi:dihydropteroate synthase